MKRLEVARAFAVLGLGAGLVVGGFMPWRIALALGAAAIVFAGWLCDRLDLTDGPCCDYCGAPTVAATCGGNECQKLHIIRRLRDES